MCRVPFWSTVVRWTSLLISRQLGARGSGRLVEAAAAGGPRSDPNGALKGPF
jgi:hypothetical protein